MIWLLLFGALFKRVVEIPGFKGGSYIEFLTPGVIVMTAISSAGWNGMAFIDDMRSGVMDRMLVSPVWRSALNVGSLVYGGADDDRPVADHRRGRPARRRALPERRRRRRGPDRWSPACSA